MLIYKYEWFKYVFETVHLKVQCFLLFCVKGGWGISDKTNCYQIPPPELGKAPLSSNSPTMLETNIAKNKKAVCAVSLFIIVVALVAVANCQKCDYQ